MDEDEDLQCLKIAKPPPTFHIVPEIISRQMGSNPLFQRKYHGSLHVVERLKQLHLLNEHQVLLMLCTKIFIN